MTVTFTGDGVWPTYIALSNDVSSGSIVGMLEIGKTIYIADEGSWYIITGTSGSSYTLKSLVMPG